MGLLARNKLIFFFFLLFSFFFEGSHKKQKTFQLHFYAINFPEKVKAGNNLPKVINKKNINMENVLLNVFEAKDEGTSLWCLYC